MRGEGCERLTIFMKSRVPLGPGKFHVVVLVFKFIRLWPWTAARSKNRAVASRGSSRLSLRRKSKKPLSLRVDSL